MTLGVVGILALTIVRLTEMHENDRLEVFLRNFLTPASPKPVTHFTGEGLSSERTWVFGGEANSEAAMAPPATP
jgi:hypothetical protein